jgi:hypothetical protein
MATRQWALTFLLFKAVYLGGRERVSLKLGGLPQHAKQGLLGERELSAPLFRLRGGLKTRKLVGLGLLGKRLGRRLRTEAGDGVTRHVRKFDRSKPARTVIAMLRPVSCPLSRVSRVPATRLRSCFVACGGAEQAKSSLTWTKSPSSRALRPVPAPDVRQCTAFVL